MSSEKYIGLDVHQATISVAVMDSQGKMIMESILETKASTLLEFLAGLRGSLFVTFEEGTWAAWLYDLLKPHVAEVLVCNPRKLPLLKQGNKSDQIDARKLAERLRLHTTCLQGNDGPGLRLFLRQTLRCEGKVTCPYLEVDVTEEPVPVQKDISIGNDSRAFRCPNAKDSCEQGFADIRARVSASESHRE